MVDDAHGLNSRLVRATNTSSFNVGNTLGPALGAVLLTTGHDYTAPAFVGAALALVALAMGLASRAADRRESASESPRVAL
ncbi:MAG: major facilitator superfamily 1 [Pseudonocardia sp.]|uniref:hypothetical protein n=1 Tax=Pseudonocardia sp. TaxID=60912 RepID=UPI0026027B3A|nr:hypothetical protein [Pseudonocardia sp.]MCU1626350.1 major facilitator superfamily 1 [Pseudonocardia sp.]MDT7697864.1 transporter, family, inner rane transport protein [Pseudonocardiales bacterium]